MAAVDGAGVSTYYQSKIDELERSVVTRELNLRRLTAQRNELNSRVRLLREELHQLQEPGSYVGEVVKAMGKKKVLVKVNPEGKYVVDLDKDIDINKCTANTRVALRNDSYTLHKILPTKVDPLVSLMKVENVPDSTYDMVGGLGGGTGVWQERTAMYAAAIAAAVAPRQPQVSPPPAGSWPDRGSPECAQNERLNA